MTPSEIEQSVAAYRARCENPQAEVEYIDREHWRYVPPKCSFEPTYRYRLKPAPKTTRRPLTQDEWARQRAVKSRHGVIYTIIAVGQDRICTHHDEWNSFSELSESDNTRTDGTLNEWGHLVWLPCYVEEVEVEGGK